MSVWIYNDSGQPFSDGELVDEIATFRKALREVAMGGGVGVIAGEGRRLEFTRSNAGVLRGALRDLIAEAGNRGLPVGDAGGGSITVEIGG